MHRCLTFVVFVIACGGWISVRAQQDTVRVLDEVTVKAYASDRPLIEVPAAIGLIKTENLIRFSNTSFLPVFNTIPGIHMEERSPGSYRFSIRGSSLRSPFGVRNVKFYWNGLPLTDGGGNTYLNLLDFSSLGSAEVIKGPAGSLYGAGTGGAVLMRSPQSNSNEVLISALAGSFRTARFDVQVQNKSDGVRTSVRYARQQSDGYRLQSDLKRDAFNTDLSFLFNPKNTLTTTVFYTDLYYQTPGGLTQAQYDADPAQARPATATLPGAVEQKASVHNKTLFGGVTYDHDWNHRWSSRLGLVGSSTDFKNSAILNYEARTERNIGARSENQYRFTSGKLTFGGEYQYFSSNIRVTSNDQGTPGTTVMSDDDVISTLALAFAQTEFDLPRKFYLTLGGSFNFLKYVDTSLLLNPELKQERKFDPVLSPRVALLKKFSENFSSYFSASKGFSPPTVAEVIPSSGVYNTGLNPELGWSFEAGFRGVFKKSFRYSVALYDFELNETIVNQPVNGLDYFVNAGTTSQKGVEVMMAWSPVFSTGRLATMSLWTSYTYNHYRFLNYVNRGNDYTGNSLTGVPPYTVVFGFDIITRRGSYLNITASQTERLPLNDANTDYADNYFLLGMRYGAKMAGRLPLEVFAGFDNILDSRYSLGNDLNAAGGRYFNAAAPRNAYLGMIARIFTSRQR